MYKKILWFAILFVISQVVKAQQYMYVQDNDLYVNVRSGAGTHHTVKDSLYNMQIVMVFNPVAEDGWFEVFYNQNSGFVHKSRLVLLPENFYKKYDSVCPALCFIAAPDCPEIVVNAALYDAPEFVKDNEEYTKAIHFKIEDILIQNILSDKLIDEVNIIAAMFTSFEAILFSGKMMFVNDYYSFSFYRNRNNKLCRGVSLLSNCYTAKLNKEELRQVIDKAKKAVANAKLLTDTIPDTDINKQGSIVYNGIGKYIQTNDFEYLDKLEQAYYMGNSDAHKLYPYIRDHYPLDGEGAHTIEVYYVRFKGYENRGEVILE